MFFFAEEDEATVEHVLRKEEGEVEGGLGDRFRFDRMSG